jgi:hypothetical protein
MEMLTSRLPRFVAVALLAAFAVSLIGFASPAGAADTRGSITIHSRVCPTHMPSGSEIFDQCHNRPGPDGAKFRLDSRQSKSTNSSGNVSFGQITSGDHLVTLTASWQPNEFLHMKVYCTNTVTGSGPNEAPIIYGNQAKFWVWLAPSGKLVCDVYFLPESGQ